MDTFSFLLSQLPGLFVGLVIAILALGAVPHRSLPARLLGWFLWGACAITVVSAVYDLLKWNHLGKALGVIAALLVLFALANKGRAPVGKLKANDPKIAKSDTLLEDVDGKNANARGEQEQEQERKRPLIFTIAMSLVALGWGVFTYNLGMTILQMSFSNDPFDIRLVRMSFQHTPSSLGFCYSVWFFLSLLADDEFLA